MKNVITLICNVDDIKLDDRLINKIFTLLEKKGCKISDLTWLSENRACDIFFEEGNFQEIKQSINEKYSDYQFDFIIQNEPLRRKKMLISDMDSTIINEECIDELADSLDMKDKISQITEKAMNGELDFSEALQERVSLLAGLDEEELIDVYKTKISLMKGAKQLVKTMSANDNFCVLVSGGFTFFTDRITEETGFNISHANILEIEDKKLTGKVVMPILDKNTKLELLNKYVNKLNITHEDVVAVGDGANDLPMLLGAGLGVAYRAKEFVKQQARNEINHTDLTSLLYAQGYKEKEFVN